MEQGVSSIMFADGAYNSKSLLNPLAKMGISLVSRLRHDASLRHDVSKRRGKKRGRKPKYGRLFPTVA